MARTRVPSEQLTFRSENTGTHLLDTYLEDAEMGGLTLATLMGKIFADDGSIGLLTFTYDDTVGQQSISVQIGTDGTPTEIADFAQFFTDVNAIKSQTENLLDQFQDNYLGPHSSDPTTDGDGDALTVGDIYFNTTDNVLKFYSGSAWVAPESIASAAATSAQSSSSAAATSETNAATSATNAAASETNASTSETNAASSSTSASTSATAAASSASAASTSAINAANSASASASSASSASSSATTASGHATTTTTRKNEIDAIFKGAHSSHPSTSGVQVGAFYFNTVAGALRLYNGTSWVDAVFDATGAILLDDFAIDVTVQSTTSGNKYALDGTVKKAYIVPSVKYKFDQSHPSNAGHQIRFSETADGTHATPAGTSYTTGITVVGTAGQAGAYTEVRLEQDAPMLYAYCQAHSGMGFIAYTGSSGGGGAGGTAAAYAVPDATASDYMWKTTEIIPNETTIVGTYQGISPDATLYVSEATSIDTHYSYFETDTVLGNHVTYAIGYVGDGATITVPSGMVLHAFGDSGSAAADKYQSTGRVVYFGDN